MQTTVKWVDGVMFLGESGTGHSVVMDGAPDQGGRNMGARPMEMILIGLGGCASFDVMTMLQKGRQQVSNCRVDIAAERVDAVPAALFPDVFAWSAFAFLFTVSKVFYYKFTGSHDLSTSVSCFQPVLITSSLPSLRTSVTGPGPV